LFLLLLFSLNSPQALHLFHTSFHTPSLYQHFSHFTLYILLFSPAPSLELIRQHCLRVTASSPLLSYTRHGSLQNCLSSTFSRHHFERCREILTQDVMYFTEAIRSCLTLTAYVKACDEGGGNCVAVRMLLRA
jgi:hypothetical protein